MTIPTPGDRQKQQIDADVAIEWADSVASRWLRTSPVAEFDTRPTPVQIRNAIMMTSVLAGQAMALDNTTRDIEEQANADQIDDWLRTCCDAVSEPDENTGRDRLIDPVGLRRASTTDKKPLRRWTAALREHAERIGVRWLRGRANGPFGFDIIEPGGRCTILEHGWPTDEDHLRALIVPTAAEAINRHAQASGKHPAPQSAMAAHLQADATDYCGQAGTQAPSWLKNEAGQ